MKRISEILGRSNRILHESGLRGTYKGIARGIHKAIREVSSREDKYNLLRRMEKLLPLQKVCRKHRKVLKTR